MYSSDRHSPVPSQRKLRKQYLDEGDSESLFFIVEEYPQDLFFSAMESKELGGDSGGDDGDFDEDHPARGELLTMIASPKADEMQEFAAKIAALKVRFPCLLLFPSAFIFFLIWPHIVYDHFTSVFTLTFESAG